MALYIPSALLLWILNDMRFLRQASAILYQGTSSETSRLAVQSVLYDRIGAENHSLRWLRAAVVAVSLFALASASGALVISPSIHAVRIVEGTLYLTPQFAKVSIAEVPDWHPSNLWVARWLVLVAVDTILCALIGRELTKIKT